MNDFAAKISELTKSIKAPKYVIAGLLVLFLTIVMLPLLKFMAIALGVFLIFIGLYPDHNISKQAIAYLDKLKQINPID